MARQEVIDLEVAVRRGAAEVTDLFGNLWARKSSMTLDREAKIAGAWRIVEANRTGTATKEGIWYDSSIMHGEHLFHNVVCRVLGRLGDKEDDIGVALSVVGAAQLTETSVAPGGNYVTMAAAKQQAAVVAQGMAAMSVAASNNLMRAMQMPQLYASGKLLTTEAKEELDAMRHDALKAAQIHVEQRAVITKELDATRQTLYRAADDNGRLRSELKEHIVVIGRLTIDNEKLTRALANALTKK